MKNKIILIASWLCVAITMLIIFGFSSQNAEKSTETSSSVIEDVLDVVLPEEEITPELVKKYQFPVRKAAHFGIYMLLGFCLVNAFEHTVKKKWYISYPCSLIVAALYAISDEWHQSFSDGRGPSAADVLIDSSGALVGIIVFLIFISLYSYIIKKKNSSKKPIN